MKGSGKKVMILAIIMAIITTYLVFTYLKNAGSSEKEIQTVDVVVATKDIEKKVAIAAADVKTIKMDKQYVLPTAHTSVNDVIGKRITDRIMAGEQILRGRIVDETNTTLAYVIPEGKRAVTINVNEASEVGDFIRPGDYVDILGTYDKWEYEDKNNKYIIPPKTVVVAQNIKILGMGQQQTLPDDPRAELSKTVTLAVTLEEAQKITLSEEKGVVRMILRRVGDDKTDNSKTDTMVPDFVPDRGTIVLPK